MNGLGDGLGQSRKENDLHELLALGIPIFIIRIMRKHPFDWHRSYSDQEGTTAAKRALGIVGNFTSAIMFIAPVYPTFSTIWRKESSQQLSGLVYVATLLNCLLWVLYGKLSNDVYIMLLNGIGFVFELTYIIVYYVFADVRIRLKVQRLLTVVVLTATIACVTVLAIKPHHTRKVAVGIICSVVTTVMYASPLNGIGTVLRTGRVASMASLYLSICMVVNTAVWTVYGLLAVNLYVIIPNAVGLLLGLVQLGLHRVYGRNEARM